MVDGSGLKRKHASVTFYCSANSYVHLYWRTVEHMEHIRK